MGAIWRGQGAVYGRWDVILTPEYPAGATDTDLFVAHVRWSADCEITGPSDWTRVRQDKVGSFTVAIFTRPASGGESGTVTFTSSVDYQGTAWIGMVGNDSGARPKLSAHDAIGVDAQSTQVTMPSVSSAAGGLLGAFYSLSLGGANSWSPPGGMTERVEYTGYNCGIGAATQAVGGGATGTRTATNSEGGYAPVGISLLFTTNSPPNAPSWVTPQNLTIAADRDFILDWNFNDPDAGDSQSAYTLNRWTRDTNGNRISGSLVSIYNPVPYSEHRIVASTLAGATSYEFQVITFDSQGVEGPASSSLFLTAQNTPPAPQFLDPTDGQTIGESSYLAQISAPNVDASEWRTVADDGTGNPNPAIVYSDPVVETSGDLRTHSFEFPTNNRTEHLQVRIEDNLLWSDWESSRNPISYTAPPAPTYVKTDDPTNGRILVAITNPAPGAGEPAMSYNNVYVDDGDGRGEIRKATLLAANAVWAYDLPRSGKNYDGTDGTSIRVEAVATNGTTSSSS